MKSSYDIGASNAATAPLWKPNQTFFFCNDNKTKDFFIWIIKEIFSYKYLNMYYLLKSQAITFWFNSEFFSVRVLRSSIVSKLI